MNRLNSPASRLPAEDLVVMPKAWQQHLVDRPGRGTPRPVEVDPEAPARLAEMIEEHAAFLEHAFPSLPDPALEAPLRAGIAGAPDPFGAALAVKLLVCLNAAGAQGYWDTARDAWMSRHGIGFTARAAVELVSMNVSWAPRRIVAWQPVRVDDIRVERLIRTPRLAEWINPIRSALAALEPAAYAEVRAALDGSDSTAPKRFARALLMPDQEAWVLDACRIHAAEGPLNVGWDPLWLLVSKREHLETSGVSVIDPYRCDVATVARLVDALGPDAGRVLIETLETRNQAKADVRKALVEALGRIPSDAAIGHLLEHCDERGVMAAVRAAAKRYPTRTLRAIAGSSESVTGMARSRLVGISRSNPLLEQAMAALKDEERAAIERLRSSSERVPTADPGAVPACFISPPWLEFVKPWAPSPFAGLVAPKTVELQWRRRERERLLAPAPNESYLADAGFWEEAAADGPRSDYLWFPEFLAYAPQELVGSAIERWDGRVRTASSHTVQGILARYGEAAVDRVLAIARSKPSYREVLRPIVSLDAARAAAEWLPETGRGRKIAEGWCKQHSEAAAALLIPDAFSDDAKLRTAAIRALRFLAESRRAVLEEQAAEYGEAVADAVRALVDPDPLDPRVERLPRIGTWADPGALPQVLLKGREAALPLEAVKTLMTALALDDVERPYAGVAMLANECDPASLTAFSWALYELWTAWDSPSGDAWAMMQLARFADGDTVRRLAGLIREWPGQGQHRKAVRGLEVLGAIGTESALWAVREIAEEAKFKALKEAASEQIDAIAERLGLSRDQLADRLVPDFGLDADAPLVLDYGPRSFTVGFDEQLRPFVIDGAGKRRANLPKPAAKDDFDLARPAYERFTAMRKHLKKVAVDQVRRLEAAMVGGRTWSGAEFKRHLVGHPLLWNLTSRLVWLYGKDGAAVSFRLAEDRTCADLEDGPFDLADDASVRLAHPVTLGSEVEAWAKLLADYEILQPFDQLARPVFAFTDGEIAAGRIGRFEGSSVDGRPLTGLLTRGWKFGDPTIAGSATSVYFEFRGGGYVAMHTEPSYYPGWPEEDLELARVEVAFPKPDTVIDPVAVSEALGAIAKIARARKK